MGGYLNFLVKLWGTVLALCATDFDNFHQALPHTYVIAFIALRIVPLCTLAYFLFRNKGGKLSAIVKTCLAGLPNEKFLFACIFIIAIVLRAWYAVSVPLVLAEGDAMARLELTKNFCAQHNFIPGGFNWLPLHFLLIGLPAFFNIDVFWGSRLMTALMGVLTIPVLYLLVELSFDSTIALITCFLLATNPFHIKYSVITMSEVPFLFFELTTLLFLVKYIKSNQLKFLLVSALFAVCGNLIRFEGWIISAILPLGLLFYRKNPKHFFYYSTILAASILAIGLMSFMATGNFLFGISLSDLEVKYNYSVITNTPQHILNGLSFDYVLSVPTLFFVFYGLYLALKNKKQLLWLGLATFIILLPFYRIITLTNEPSWRYLSTGLFLLLPFAAWGIKDLVKQNASLGLSLILIVTIVRFVRLEDSHEVLAKHLNDPKGFYEAAAWLKKHKSDNDKFLYDGKGIDYPCVRLTTNSDNDEMYFPATAGMKAFNNYEDYNDSVFLRVIRTPGYKHIFCQCGSTTDSILHHKPVLSDIVTNGPVIDPVYSNEDYRIYSIRDTQK